MQVADEAALGLRIGGRVSFQLRQLGASEGARLRDEEYAAHASLHNCAARVVLPVVGHLRVAR
jgi:hypothetical protein